MNSHPYLTSMTQSALERRPRLFQKAAEKNSAETQEEAPELPSARNRESTLPAEPIDVEKDNKLQTVRKRYRCEDYMENQELKLQAMERAYEEDANKNKDPSLPVQDKEEDKQLEYFKSDEYKRYLEALTQTHTKEDKLRALRENRNNNIYLGKGDRKQYIQAIIKTKQVLPRVALPKFDEMQPKIQEQPQPIPVKKTENRPSYRVQIKKNEIEEESPIKCTPIFEATTYRDKKGNETLALQPVCIQRTIQEDPPQIEKPSKPTTHKHSFPLESSYLTKNPKPPELKVRKDNANTFIKHTRQEDCFNKNTERAAQPKDKSSKKQVIRYRIQEKENSPIYLTPSPSNHTNSSSPRKTPHLGIYQVSFKIQKPCASKRPNYQPQPPTPQKKYKQPLTQRQPQRIYHHHAQPPKRIFTEFLDFLPYSHSTSTATKPDPKSTKISLISKSKHRL